MPLATLAAAALGSKTAFNYNRENFLYDRRLRMLKEFQEMKFRIIQGDLWRQDVRDIIGLVETKAEVLARQCNDDGYLCQLVGTGSHARECP
jgi:hypothetical protein